MLHKTQVAIGFCATKLSPQTTRNVALVYACGVDGQLSGQVVAVRSRDCQIFSAGYFITFSYPWSSTARESFTNNSLDITTILRLLKLSLQFLWVYWKNKPTWDVGRTLEKLVNHLPPAHD